MKTIVIDPGHGGSDPGAVNGTRMEKNDNLRLSLAVAKKLRDQGQNVIMTRDTDVSVPLIERSAISNRNNADMFVSIHRNSVANNPSANGVENFVQTGSPPNYKTYATKVLNRIVEQGVQSNRGVREGNYSVLRNTVAPAMLLEMGFITNARDNQLFDASLESYSTAITRGILESLGEPYRETPQLPGSSVVKSIQETLNKLYNTGLAVDGSFGPATRRALVIGLQTELNRLFNANLTVDGAFGPKTKAAVPLVRRGSQGNLVYLLQAALYGKGYPTELDSIFGPNTETTVKNFQRNNGLSADGVAGPDTFSKLFS